MPEPSLRPRSVREQSISGLLERLPGARLHGEAETPVRGVTHDSRQVQPGDLYLARAGERTHGIDHVDEALAAGAVAVLTDRAAAPAAVAAGVPVVVEVDDPRAVAGAVAAWAYGDPSRDLLVIGITGTNGKTTTAYLVDAGLRGAGRVTGLVGTVETRIAADVAPSLRTTPEATDLQAMFALMRERGVDAVAMEVSSHALALHRVTGTTFAVAAFTNLSQDHLDFHTDMDDYFAAKAQLFTPRLSRRGVVCVDDDWGRRLARSPGIPVTTVGAAPADWTRVDESVTSEGGRAVLGGPDGTTHPVEVALPGRFNLRNAVVAYVALVEAGVDHRSAREGIATLRAVPGRMERVGSGQPFLAVVDYAHTPDAVATLLVEARALAGTNGHVLVVLGCGGDRDRAKRPRMGEAAARGADVAVFTNDNPRSEDPQTILDAMLAGARDSGGRARVLVEADRRKAISLAVEEAGPGDVLVVAGKGHEQGQEYADRTLPFDDRVVLRESLTAHGYPVVA